MTENYDYVEDYISNMLRELYSEMNEYLENILNSPSTINRIIRYYAMGLPSDPSVNERYIMFGGKVVKEYEIDDFKKYLYNGCMIRNDKRT